MRRTITLDQDVEAAVRRLQKNEGIGLSDAVNRLVRAGLTVKHSKKPFRQRSVKPGLRADVTNVAQALELLDGPAGR
jgi:hypothetical protein